MKVGKNQNASLFLATYWNLSLKVGDLEKKILKILQIRVVFFMKNRLCKAKTYFSSQNLAKICN
jgi:hypothetical protein